MLHLVRFGEHSLSFSDLAGARGFAARVSTRFSDSVVTVFEDGDSRFFHREDTRVSVTVESFDDSGRLVSVDTYS